MKKITSLQALRGLAFLGILCFHCGWSSLGFPGVSIFFVLSGFLLEYQYGEREMEGSLRGSFRFAIRHVGKLYPLHVVTLLLAAVLVLLERLAYFNPASVPWDVGEFLANLFLVHAWSTMPIVYISYNGVSWFLSVCLFLYFVYPLLHRWINKYAGVRTAILTSVVCFGLMVIVAFISQYVSLPPIMTDNFPKWLTYICPLYRLGDFFLGCNLGYVYCSRGKKSADNIVENVAHKKDPKGTLRKKEMAVYTLAEVLAFLYIVAGNQIAINKSGVLGSEWCRYTVLFLPASVAIVALFALKKGALTGMLTNPVLVRIGDLSAYAFLIHQLFYRCAMKFLEHFGVEVSRGGYILITLVGTLLAAYLWSLLVLWWKKRTRNAII